MRNSTIKPYRETICKSCNGTAIKKTIGGYCFEAPHFHYQKAQQSRYQAKTKERKQAKNKTAEQRSGMTLGKWFNAQISMMPNECECCGDYLNPNIHISQRAYIAHIVPKKYFVSVMTHPLNRLFLCVDCHSKFDNCLSREVIKMKCWPIAVKRFSQFQDQIDQHEVSHLRDCFLQEYREKCKRDFL